MHVQNYLYGVDTAATKTSFLDSHKFPDLSIFFKIKLNFFLFLNHFVFFLCMMCKLGATDCPKLFQNYSDAVDKLKTAVDIKPKVIQDFNAIHEKFPCNRFIYDFLQVFVSNSFLVKQKRTNFCFFKLKEIVLVQLNILSCLGR